MAGIPVYPVSVGYAKVVSLMHKPWSRSEQLGFVDNPCAAIDEFHDFKNKTTAVISL